MRWLLDVIEPSLRPAPSLSPEQTFEFVGPAVARRHVLGAAFLQRLFKLFEQLALMLRQFDGRLNCDVAIQVAWVAGANAFDAFSAQTKLLASLCAFRNVNGRFATECGVYRYFKPPFPRSARAAGSREAVNRVVFGDNPPLSTPMATSNSPICGHFKFPQWRRQERTDCDSESSGGARRTGGGWPAAQGYPRRRPLPPIRHGRAPRWITRVQREAVGFGGLVFSISCR